MAKVQSQPEKKVGNIPSKKRKKKKGTNVYCDLCRRSYNKADIQVHVHSMQHHRELEAIMGKDSSHECQVCNESSMDLNVYAQHISTGKHIGKLKSLKSRNEKPPSLDKVLGTEVMMKILQRNKMLKKSKKKEMKKKRKRMKAGQKHAEKQAVQNDAITSKVARMGDFKQNKMILKHDIQNEGKNNAFFQNKENNVSCRGIWQLPYNQDQFIPLAQQLRSGDHFSVNSHSSPSKPQGRKTDTCYRPHSTHAYPPRVPKRIAWSAVRQRDTHKKPYNSETDFASDNLPQNGAIIFDQSLGPSEPLQQRSCCSPPPAPANISTNAVLVRDVDISAMLRQIRRELGVREPCRADREARRQHSEAAGVKMVQPAGAIEGALHITSAAAASVRTSPVSSHEPVLDSGVHPSEKVPAQPKCTSAKMTQGRSQTCEKSSVFAGDTYRSSHCSAASSEAVVNICRRVRIAHKPRNVQEGKEANKEQSLIEVCQDVRRKTQQKAKGTPRSADGLLSHASEQHISTQAEDVPLSEGFHWESLQHSPSFAHWSKSCAETGPLIEIAPKHPDPQPEDGNRLTTCIKEEQILEGENGDLINHISAPKRKHKVMTHDGVSDEEPRGKKKVKANKDQDQMAQLLTVSLREEELSHSLEVLDSSLIQARNALQAAYTEVQRLLLFRQQCTAEVNSLRSKRITILQGMQGGLSFPGESNIAERNVTSAVEPAAVVTQSQIFPLSSSAAFPASSCQLPLQTNPASSISRPQPATLSLPTMPLKQEIEQLPLSCTSQPRTEFIVPVSVSPGSSACQQEQVRREELKDFVKTVVFIADTDDEGADIRPVAEKVSTVISERDHNTSAALTNNSGGSESDNSVILIEPPNWEVIDIDETAANVPLHQDIPQKSVSVEFSSASTQTSQQNYIKSSLPTELVQDAAVPSASAVEEEEEEPSLGLFENHQGPVHGLQVYEGRLYTCSGDNTARSYSLRSKECQAVFTGHTKKVNCLMVSSFPNMPVHLFTGSSDQTIRCYDIKTQVCLEQIFLSDRVLCLHIAWNILFAGLANGSVANYDLKTLKQLDMFECHGPRGVSSLGTAQEGARRVLLVGSYDSTISIRDARNGLLLRTLEGHTKTVLCMKVVNDLVFSGSSDTSVQAHNIHTGELIRIYKGHGHAVISIVILGEVMVTACLDKVVRVYELQSHDLLQVYGGHRDVVMCMTVHKSVIYTGCYDGSVQAVKLDLMKNYRCWWQNCSLIFGMEEHLVQHLIKDHTNPNLQTAKCRWKGCSAFFCKQESVRQELPEHMQNHVENDSEVHT